MSEIPAGTVYNPFAYDQDENALQNMLLTSLVVAGKVARIQQHKLQLFYTEVVRWYWYFCSDPEDSVDTPTWCLMLHCLDRQMPGWIETNLRKVKMGQYTRLTRAFKMVAQRVSDGTLNLRTCPPADLEEIPGIGMKSSRFFLLFTRRNARYACLDTHILRYMSEQHIADGVIPKVTPSSRYEYLRLELLFLQHCDELNKVLTTPKSIAQIDFEIWLQKNRGDKINYDDKSKVS